MPLSPKGFPVLLSFDLDAETMWTARDPKNVERPILMSQGAYGWKVGVPRILEVLRRHDVLASFFMPAVCAQIDPGETRRIRDAGHASAWLAVVGGNARARAFYERQGWVDEGQFTHDAPGPEGPIPVTAHRYVKTLS